MIAFNSGTCTVFKTNGKRSLVKKLGSFRFKEETLGIKAVNEFKLNGIEIERTILLPYNDLINRGSVVRIGQDVYKIELIQPKDTQPKTLKLTLSKDAVKWEDETI